MKKLDRDGLILAKLLGETFELSESLLSCSSEIFIRRFFHSNIKDVFDNQSILDDCYTPKEIIRQLNKEYPNLQYGSVKYSKNELYWMGYMYASFAYIYELTYPQIYKLITPKDLVSTYIAYHTLSIEQALERILDDKDIKLDATREQIKDFVVEMFKTKSA